MYYDESPFLKALQKPFNIEPNIRKRDLIILETCSTKELTSLLDGDPILYPSISSIYPEPSSLAPFTDSSEIMDILLEELLKNADGTTETIIVAQSNASIYAFIYLVIPQKF